MRRKRRVRLAQQHDRDAQKGYGQPGAPSWRKPVAGHETVRNDVDENGAAFNNTAGKRRRGETDADVQQDNLKSEEDPENRQRTPLVRLQPQRNPSATGHSHSAGQPNNNRQNALQIGGNASSATLMRQCSNPLIADIDSAMKTVFGPSFLNVAPAAVMPALRPASRPRDWSA